MTESQGTLQLSSQPDGYGFLYGQYTREDGFAMVNVLPPEKQFWGTPLDGYEPHATDWKVYIAGEFVFQAPQMTGLTARIITHLDAQPSPDEPAETAL